MIKFKKMLKYNAIGSKGSGELLSKRRLIDKSRLHEYSFVCAEDSHFLVLDRNDWYMESNKNIQYLYAEKFFCNLTDSKEWMRKLI